MTSDWRHFPAIFRQNKGLQESLSWTQFLSFFYHSTNFFAWNGIELIGLPSTEPKWLTYKTFRSSVCGSKIPRKSVYNSNAYLSMFRTSHNKIKSTIGILSSNCIWLLTFIKLEIWPVLASPWPDLDYKLLKIAFYDTVDAVIRIPWPKLTRKHVSHYLFLISKFSWLFVT